MCEERALSCIKSGSGRGFFQGASSVTSAKTVIASGAKQSPAWKIASSFDSSQ